MEQHPLTQISEQAGRDTRKWMNTNVNMFAEYDAPFLKGLKFKFQYSRNTYNRLYKEVAMPYTLYTFETSGTNGHYMIRVKTHKLQEPTYVVETALSKKHQLFTLIYK